MSTEVIYIAKKDCNRNLWILCPYERERNFYWMKSVSSVYDKEFPSLSKAMLSAIIEGIPLYWREEDSWCLDYKYSEENLKKWFKENK